jgi:hypothetical protein
MVGFGPERPALEQDMEQAGHDEQRAKDARDLTRHGQDPKGLERLEIVEDE